MGRGDRDGEENGSREGPAIGEGPLESKGRSNGTSSASTGDVGNLGIDA